MEKFGVTNLQVGKSRVTIIQVLSNPFSWHFQGIKTLPNGQPMTVLFNQEKSDFLLQNNRNISKKVNRSEWRCFLLLLFLDPESGEKNGVVFTTLSTFNLLLSNREGESPKWRVKKPKTFTCQLALLRKLLYSEIFPMNSTFLSSRLHLCYLFFNSLFCYI